MRKKLMMLGITVLVFGCMAWAKSLTGVVSDDHCLTKHSTASDEAAACVAKCVQGGSKYVLVSHGKVYKLDAQDKFADFAGKRVKVMGDLKGEEITVASVEAAPAGMLHKKGKEKSESKPY